MTMIIVVMLTIFINIQGLNASNVTEGEWESMNRRDVIQRRDHRRHLLDWPFRLGECQGSCGRGLLGFNRRCRSGLDCTRDNQADLVAYGLDRQFAYCQIPNFRGQRYFCYDPTKLISPSVRPSVKPSASPSKKPSSKPSSKPSDKPSSKPSRKPSVSFKPSGKPPYCCCTSYPGTLQCTKDQYCCCPSASGPQCTGNFCPLCK